MNVESSTNLTPREVTVLQAIADGEPMEKVAEIIGFTSIGGAKNLMYKIYEKLGADNRAHAIAICFRRHLIE